MCMFDRVGASSKWQFSEEKKNSSHITQLLRAQRICAAAILLNPSPSHPQQASQAVPHRSQSTLKYLRLSNHGCMNPLMNRHMAE